MNVLTIVDVSFLSRRAWARVHSNAYTPYKKSVFVDFAGEFALDLACVRKSFDGPMVLAVDHEGDTWRTEFMAQHYRDHASVWADEEGDRWVVLYDGIGLDILWTGSKWEKKKLSAKAVSELKYDGLIREADERVINKAVEAVCPKYKDRAWPYAETREEYHQWSQRLWRRMASAMHDTTFAELPKMEADDIASLVAYWAVPEVVKGAYDKVVFYSSDSDWDQLRLFYSELSARHDGSGFVDKGFLDIHHELRVKILGGDIGDNIPGCRKGLTKLAKDGADKLVSSGQMEIAVEGAVDQEDLFRNDTLVRLVQCTDGGTVPTIMADNDSELYKKVVSQLKWNYNHEDAVIPWDDMVDPIRRMAAFHAATSETAQEALKDA